MSEHGYGWWQAADGQWYPPEQHPSHDPNDSSSYGWWQAADGNSYPPNRHPDYRAAPSAASAPPTMPPPSPGSSPPAPAGGGGSSSGGTSGLAAKGLTPTMIGVLVAAVLIVIGSVMPWATIDLGFVSQSIGGLDGDGGITLVLALVTAVLAYLSKGRKTGLAIGAVVAAAISALIAVIDIADVSSLGGAGDLGIDTGVSVGIGLWLVLIASLGAVGAGIKLILDCRNAS